MIYRLTGSRVMTRVVETQGDFKMYAFRPRRKKGTKARLKNRRAMRKQSQRANRG